jgi:hypothetical protein
MTFNDPSEKQEVTAARAMLDRSTGWRRAWQLATHEFRNLERLALFGLTDPLATPKKAWSPAQDGEISQLV